MILTGSESFAFQQEQQSCLTLSWVLVDDFTSIHTKKRPEKDQSSEAKTMCTIVVKACKEIPAIAVEQAIHIHDQNGIDIDSCQRLITSASCMHNIRNSYASEMPDWLTESFFSPELERQRINIHQYCDNDKMEWMLKPFAWVRYKINKPLYDLLIYRRKMPSARRP